MYPIMFDVLYLTVSWLSWRRWRINRRWNEDIREQGVPSYAVRLQERVRMQEESRGRWWCGERELNKQRRTVECAHSRPRLIVSQWHIRSSAGAGHRITIIAPFLVDPPWNVHLWKADYRDSVTGFAENRSSTFLSSHWPSEEMCVRAINKLCTRPEDTEQVTNSYLHNHNHHSLSGILAG